MKNMVAIVLIIGLVLGGLQAAAFQQTKSMNIQQTFSFAQPRFTQHNDQTRIELLNTNSWLTTPGCPLLPVYRKTFTFTAGTKITTVQVQYSQPETYTLSTPLLTAPYPKTTLQPQDDESDYVPIPLTSMYPSDTYTSMITRGLNSTQRVTYLTVTMYPVRFDPLAGRVLYSSSAHLNVYYELPRTQNHYSDTYDLLIIAPEEFADTLEPLVEHKKSVGIETKLVTRSEICEGTYFPAEGRDCAEEMKYFIKNALEEWNITYVLLVGGMKGQRNQWYIPVRYANLDDESDFETSYLSDLYFADIYDGEGNFSSWDSNANNIFGEWIGANKDIIDMVPDVILGRLPCRNERNLKILVDKIIEYETTTYGQTWFNTMVVVGGDSAPGYIYYEGEEENKKALEYMSDFTGVKLWTSDGSLTGPKVVIDAVSAGCGFLFFDGHGNPSTWSTHPPDNESVWITGLSNPDMFKLNNGDMLPICVVGACHNGQFNVTLLNMLKGILTERLKYFQRTYYFKDWVPECWAWRMVQKKDGGAIAIMAYTGLDWFAEGDYDNDSIPDCIQYYSGFANVNFFKNYGVNNLHILGQAHTQTLVDYITAFPPMENKYDCKTVQEFALLGDPTLLIGGYQ